MATTWVWAALILSRVASHGLERLRYPGMVPPAWAETIQGVALWPCVVAGVYLTLRTGRQSSAARAVVVAVVTSLIVGVLAGPACVVGALLSPSEAALRAWLDEARPTGSRSWPWLSVIVDFSALYLSCLAIAIGFLSFRTLRHERLRRLSAEAMATRDRLRVLRAQLNAHFLFNALNSIASLNDTEPPASQRLLVQLSDLLRRTLTASEREEHRLSEELAYIETYLHIQQIRLPSRLRWRIRADPHCSMAQVPSLILLPLVENAAVHGPRGGLHVVEIDVDLAYADGYLVMAVTNACHPSSVVQDVRPGLGLRNVRERLQMLYGREAMLVARFMMGGRFNAVIHLPAPRCAVQTHEPSESQCES